MFLFGASASLDAPFKKALVHGLSKHPSDISFHGFQWLLLYFVLQEGLHFVFGFLLVFFAGSKPLVPSELLLIQIRSHGSDALNLKAERNHKSWTVDLSSGFDSLLCRQRYVLSHFMGTNVIRCYY